MSFIQMLFPDQPTAAPIEDRNLPPQAPQVMPAPGQVQPQPMPAPAMGQVQQAPMPQAGQAGPAPADPQKVSQWRELMHRIAQPDVLGPLQTFLAVASAPLNPGENMGARLGYAGLIAQMHKGMLAENARTQPHAEKMRELEVRTAEAGLDRTRTQTEAAQFELGEKQQTQKQRLEKLNLEIARAKTAGDVERLALLEAERKAVLGGKYDETDRRLDQAYKQAQIAKARRDANAPYPQTGGAGAGDAQAQAQILTAQGLMESMAEGYKNSPEAVAGRVDFWTWVNTTYGPQGAQQLAKADALLRAMGYRVTYPGGAQAAPGPAGQVDTYDQVRARVEAAKKGKAAPQPAPGSAFPPGLVDKIPK